MKRFDYYKAAALVPPVQLADPMANAKAMAAMCQDLDADTQLALFPELSLTGYACQDLFYDTLLLDKAKEALVWLAGQLPENLACIAGLPLVHDDKLYNAAAFVFDGKILGFYAKTNIPGYNEYYEPRWFESGASLPENAEVQIDGRSVPVSSKILFEDTSTGAIVGIEICEDLWVSIPVSSYEAAAGANILVNCSASNEVIAKSSYRKELVKSQSARSYAGYLYCSAGPDESTSDLVFSGHCLAAENGSLLGETPLFQTGSVLYAEFDLGNLRNDRLRFKTAFQKQEGFKRICYASLPYADIALTREVQAYPFISKDEKLRLERCRQILAMQAQALATRLKKIHCKSAVIGISGGLDSTLALLATAKAFKILNLDPAGILAVTMPGFGTTSRTRSNAEELIDLLQATFRCIPIGDAVMQHFQDIGHDPEVKDITYENSQARERTQILMDLANKTGGIVIGTGDLSELALGWCTYNGDHMSMYAVNASIPKTLVRYLVESQALEAKEQGNEALYDVLMDICDTPVSPELLPPDAQGKIAQKTEEVLGSYDLHDFFLYHMLRHHESPAKIFALANKAFPGMEDDIRKAMNTFYWRFFSQQFKRNCMPDGVKVGSVCFSPRGDWRMPSDASARAWLEELKTL